MTGAQLRFATFFNACKYKGTTFSSYADEARLWYPDRFDPSTHTNSNVVQTTNELESQARSLWCSISWSFVCYNLTIPAFRHGRQSLRATC